MPSEKSIQNAIVKKFRKLPSMMVEVRHGNAFSVVGRADIFDCWFGQHFEIELKQPGEEPSKKQLYELEQWRKAGAVAGWATTVKEALAIISEIKPLELFTQI